MSQVKCGKPHKKSVKRYSRKLYKVTNEHDRLQNYLEEHGAVLVVANNEAAWYKRTPQFLSLLESYTIEYWCIPNRL